MGQLEVAVAFMGPMAAFFVWRYVERTLDWLEPPASRVISSSFAMVVRYVAWNRWQWLLVFVVLLYAAANAWFFEWTLGVAAIAGFAMAVCLNSTGKWEPILWGLFLIGFGAYLAVQIGVVARDGPFAVIGLPFIVAGFLYMRDGLRLVRGKPLRRR